MGIHALSARFMVKHLDKDGKLSEKTMRFKASYLLSADVVDELLQQSDESSVLYPWDDSWEDELNESPDSVSFDLLDIPDSLSFVELSFVESDSVEPDAETVGSSVMVVLEHSSRIHLISVHFGTLQPNAIRVPLHRSGTAYY